VFAGHLLLTASHVAEVSERLIESLHKSLWDLVQQTGIPNVEKQ
jgi:hypothetical protein